MAVITLNRPEAANAQTMDLLDELDAAWSRAAADDEVVVIVLRANGKHFSAGHDLKRTRVRYPTRSPWRCIYKIEARRYLEYSLRWRNIPKPSIAAVQGRCIAGGLLLCWPCDLIVAAENAQFSDPVVLMGIGGVEYHGHTWELGPRKAKEILFTGPRGDRRGGRAGRHGEPRGASRPSWTPRTMELARQIAGMHAVRAPAGQARRQPDPGRPGVLRRDPVGVRHPPDRARQRAQRQRLPGAGPVSTR